MKRMTSTLLVVAFSFSTLARVGPPRSIYGVYQTCPFHCRTIKINSNHTFEYRLNGDLYHDERYKGTWVFVGRNKLRATSPIERSPLKVIEKPRPDAGDYSVLVLDPNVGVVPGAVISGRGNQGPFAVKTDQTGIVHIPRCREFKLTLNHYTGTHRIRNSSAREFVVQLNGDQIVNRAIDETWLVESGRLYVAGQDGTFDKNYWSDRLSNKEAFKIFH